MDMTHLKIARGKEMPMAKRYFFCSGSKNKEKGETICSRIEYLSKPNWGVNMALYFLYRISS